MQHQSLSFTIPYTSSAIRGVITALNQMDNDLNGTVGLFTAPSPSSISPSGVEYRDVQNSPAAMSHVNDASVMTPPPPEPFDEGDEGNEGESAQPLGAVDANGMLWDERIHASTKTFVANGTWKMKRGVDKTLVDQVVSELMGNVPVTSPTQNSVTTPPPPVEHTVEVVAPTPVAPVTGSPFRQLLADIAKAGLTPDYVQNTCREVNGVSLPECREDVAKLDMLRMSLGL